MERTRLTAQEVYEILEIGQVDGFCPSSLKTKEEICAWDSAINYVMQLIYLHEVEEDEADEIDE